jgi:phosphodiesterase/alkaline phosphatase D-like protein
MEIVRRNPRRVQRLSVERLETRELLTATPYVIPVDPAVSTQSILTVGDSVGGYRMVGIPDGLGAFDNGNGTFTLLMNHELGNASGVTRAHSSVGAFVSEWIIDKNTLQVLSGQDLMQQVFLWDTATQQSNTTPSAFAFNRFCSADLPAVSAYYNAATGLGTQERIYMHGEEGGSTGFQVATVVTGPDAGKTYALGKFNLSTNGSGLTGVGAWENSLANPFAQDKTIVIGDSDGGTGIMTNALAVYVGTKTNTGSPVDKAGLTNGTLKFVNVAGNTAEIVNNSTRATNITSGTRFTLSGTSSTTFSRPEDGAWNPSNPKEYYFVTTDQLDRVSDALTPTQVGQTRLWRLTFDDITNPDLGGKIDLLIDGRTVNGQKVNMFDNIAVNPQTGHIILLEDVGGAPHNGKVWDYDPASDTLVQIAKHDPARFGNVGLAATAPFNNDEETSGVIDVSSILGNGSYLLVDQAHYLINSSNPNGFSNPNELVEGGQLMLLRITPKVSFVGVGAGDATSTDAILWTRAQDITRTTGVGLIAQVSTDSTFASGLATFAGITDPVHDYTIHINATGLEPGTRYFYRFVADDDTVSQVGTFVTAPSATESVPVRFGFTGDADGLMRPYDATNSPDFAAPGAANFAQSNFDYFVWLGDTIYETASGAGTPNFSPAVNNTPNITEYWRKYREQFLPVHTGSYAGLTSFFDSTGHYTLLDNHELGNRQFINGGAPETATFNTTDPQFDVNTTGTYYHNTSGFNTLLHAYDDYQPVRIDTVVAPTDPRSDGTQKMYFAQQWGANSIFINVDDRTNRDIRLRNASGDDTGPRGDNPDRTMLGATELEWLKDSLLDAQANGIVWKIVAISSPIDQIGSIGSGSDGGKSWIGGYRAERNNLLEFIADNQIDHVIFLSTDDHQLRVNELGYFTQFTTNTLGYPAPVQSSYTRVPGAVSIVAGPIGATGPDTITDHSFSNIKSLADALVASEIATDVDPIGLDASFPGLKNVTREGDPNASTTPTGFDFYSPDTFNYATLDISADGTTLTVGVQGINSYTTNTFPQPGSANPIRNILQFQIGLETTGIAAVSAAGAYGGTATLTAILSDTTVGAPLAGKTIVFSLGGHNVGTADTDANGVATLPNVSLAGYDAGTFADEVSAAFDGDAANLSSSNTGHLVVSSDATSTQLTSSANPAVFSQLIGFTATVSNSTIGGLTPVGTVQFIVDGSNFGAPVPLDATGHATSANLSFLAGANHTIEAVFSDATNFAGSNASLAQATVTIAREPDPLNPTLIDLFVGATASSDHIEVSLKNNQIIVDLHDGNPTTTPMAGLNALVVYGQSANERIKVARNLTLPAFLFGGNGANVQIEGGGGPTVEVGGSGQNNHLKGGTDRNILIAGIGGGHLEGDGTDDILIGGYTDYDQNLTALEAVLNEWNRSDESYLQRVANLQNAPATAGGQTVSPNGSYTAAKYLTASTVHDNGVVDKLEGNGGLDWFLGQLTDDKKDKVDGVSNEIKTNIS